MSPAKVSEVRLSPDETQADVIVPDFQLSLAIGKMGVNATLAARLTGVRIDIKSESEAAAEGNAVVRRPAEAATTETMYAEGEWKTNIETGAMEWHAADGSILSQEQVAAQSGGAAEDSRG
jgi:N utilization substance protein A